MSFTELSSWKEWLPTLLNRPLLQIESQTISLLWLIQVMILLSLVTLLARGIKRFLKYYLLVKLKLSEGDREVTGTLTSLGLATLGYIVVLQGMGLDFTSLAVIVGGLGIGIGFGLQELTRNLVSGLTLLGENKLKVGDLISFKGNLGFIKEISIRSTVIRTFKGSELVVPNNHLTSEPIENWNYENCQGRIEIPVGVDYSSDPLLVTELLLESAFMEESVVTNPSPKVIFKQFGDNALLFELWVWVNRIDNRQFIISSLNYIIEYNFRERGIKIPFPQRDLWLKNPDELATLIRGQKDETSSVIQSRKIPTLKSYLQKISCFSSLNDLQLRNIIEMGKRRHLSCGETFIQQGEIDHHFNIVLSGQIDAIFENQKISNRLLTFKSGDYFGELPLMLDVPYPTTMIAATDTFLFMIGKECFHDLLTQYPHLAEDVANELANRKAVLASYQDELKEMGLLEEEINHPVEWIRKRIVSIFNL
ncbi:MAG: mechanosensitive ion channel [Crocosphaera sp.]|nr:mechanosensitive ion channel [Crocosphaera sp.]